ncbi:hypothetical protein ACFYQA_17340 [Streptomyces sp. NPDC005774]|uniref:hypothetical protein n=1 Tax=Streptomyces sp. NPDC005774 TaxID=3364728 RepID=UPI0036C02550
MVKITSWSRHQVLLALEVAFVVLFLAGVGMLHVPAALMVGGVLGAVATEREMTRQAPVQRHRKGAEG